jgi:FkbM family methyltransferase
MIADLARRAGNVFYKFAYPIYLPLYSAFKAHTDRAERRLLASALTSGSVVVDAGANIGVYSHFLSRCVGAEGMVHSFEPSPDNFARLTTATRHLQNVHTNQLAVSDTTGEQLLYVSNTLNVDHRTYPSPGEVRQAIPVRSIRLDDYFLQGDRVDLLKLDVQGFELRALQGADRILSDNSGIALLVECWPHALALAGDSAESLYHFLRDRGFDVYKIGRGSLNQYDGNPGASSERTYFNLFAMREVLSNRLTTRFSAKQ